jgi:hypothetical protein
MMSDEIRLITVVLTGYLKMINSEYAFNRDLNNTMLHLNERQRINNKQYRNYATLILIITSSVLTFIFTVEHL